MKLIVVSGRSGSGKSTALHALEDQGFHCVDNLPVGLLPRLVENAADEDVEVPFAVSIDARNLPAALKRFPEIYSALKADRPDVQTELVFIDADPGTLVRRFSETRRRHPLTSGDVSLQDALAAEDRLLASIRDHADLVLDTTRMTVHGLRDQVRERVAGRGTGLSLLFRSFGFKRGIPVDADMVFDVRCLPNPHWLPELRDHDGRASRVSEWLAAHEDVREMEGDIRRHVERWLPAYEANSRSYFTIAIGCTGGHHRSVYLAERLGEYFATRAKREALERDVLTQHRDLETLQRPAQVRG
ncbi:MAG: RNase adapter RapZ [Pseudomonadales bacterium]|nr:RNase adapter RapZ [Pseudomonadales bacterium]